MWTGPKHPSSLNFRRSRERSRSPKSCEGTGTLAALRDPRCSRAKLSGCAAKCLQRHSRAEPKRCCAWTALRTNHLCFKASWGHACNTGESTQESRASLRQSRANLHCTSSSLAQLPAAGRHFGHPPGTSRGSALHNTQFKVLKGVTGKQFIKQMERSRKDAGKNSFSKVQCKAFLGTYWFSKFVI